MKRFFFSMAMLLPALAFTQNDYPCARAFDVSNNGNGGQNCPSNYPGNSAYKKDGMIIVNFKNALPVHVNAPDVLTVQELVNQNLQAVADMKFILKKISQDRLSAEYCFYSKNNSNLFNGQGGRFVFTMQYEGLPPQTCDAVPEGPVAITLPVKWVFFTATQNNRTVLLQWETAAEENSKGFYVEKNINGEWKEAGFVPSASNGGFSDKNLAYKFEDHGIAHGMVQYRLKQEDIDGKFSYSEVRSLQLEGLVKPRVFPNPTANGNITIQAGENYFNITVMDAMGRKLQQVNKVKNSYTLTGLKRGQYLVLITDMHQQQIGSERVVVQ